MWPDAFYVTYDYLVTGEVRAIRENGAASGAGVLATYSYDDLGRRIGIARGNGTNTSVTPDAVSRLAGLTQDLAGTAGDLTLGFGYTAASQLAGATRSNDAYGWRGGYNRNEATSIDGLNRATAVGGTAIGHDARGNVTGIGAKAYSYSAENLLLAGPNGATLGYDPLTRLYETRQSATTRFGYDGADMIAEYDASNVLQRRYVHGPGADEPLVWYEGSGTSDRRWLHADERGSIIALSDGTGASIATNRYDEYGVPALGNSGRFQYTGQAWLPDLGMYYYKARMYAPGLGRFLQTDPIGYGDGMNLYGYVGGDPVNRSDPSGMVDISSNYPFFPSSSGGLGFFNLAIQTPGPNGSVSIGYGAVSGSPGYRASANGTGSGSLTDTVSGDVIVTAIINHISFVGNPTASFAAENSMPQNYDIIVTANIPVPPSNLPGGPYTAQPTTPGNRPGNFLGPKQPKGPRPQTQWVPPENEGGPPGSKGYWKVQLPGEPVQSYNQSGDPFATRQDAHPNPLGETRPFFFLGPVGAFLCLLFCASPAR